MILNVVWQDGTVIPNCLKKNVSRLNNLYENVHIPRKNIIKNTRKKQLRIVIKTKYKLEGGSNSLTKYYDHIR